MSVSTQAYGGNSRRNQISSLCNLVMGFKEGLQSTLCPRNVLIPHRLAAVKHFCASWLETRQPHKTLVDWRPRSEVYKQKMCLSIVSCMFFLPFPHRGAVVTTLSPEAPWQAASTTALPTHMFSPANPRRVDWNRSLGERWLCCYPSTYTSPYQQFLAVAF